MATDVAAVADEMLRVVHSIHIILLHRPLPLVGVSIAMKRERQQNDRTLANGYMNGQTGGPLDS